MIKDQAVYLPCFVFICQELAECVHVKSDLDLCDLKQQNKTMQNLILDLKSINASDSENGLFRIYSKTAEQQLPSNDTSQLIGIKKLLTGCWLQVRGELHPNVHTTYTLQERTCLSGTLMTEVQSSLNQKKKCIQLYILMGKTKKKSHRVPRCSPRMNALAQHQGSIWLWPFCLPCFHQTTTSSLLLDIIVFWGFAQAYCV